MATEAEVQEALQRGLITPEAAASIPISPPESDREALAAEAESRGLAVPPFPGMATGASFAPGERAFGRSLPGRVQTGLTATNRGLAGTIGAVPELVNFGLQQVGLGTERPLGGTEDVLALFDALGFTPKVEAPQDTLNEIIEAAGGALGATALPVAGTLGVGTRLGAQALPPVARTLPRQIGREAALGAARRPGATVASEVGLSGVSGVGEVAGGAVEEAITGEDTGIGRTLGATLTPLAPIAAGGAIRTLARGTGSRATETRANVAEFERAGVDPTLGDVADVRRTQFLQRAVENLPGGGQIARASERAQGQLADRITNVTGQTGRLDRSEIGRVARTGLEKFVGRFQDRSAAEFDRLANLMGPNLSITATNTRSTLDRLTRPVAGGEALSEALSNSEIRRFSDAFNLDVAGAEIPALPFRTLNDLRRAVGRKITDSVLIADAPIGELKQLYAAISDDIQRAAGEVGPRAARAFERANNFYSAGQGRLESQINRLLRTSNPEDVFKAVELGGQKGATRIRAIRRSLEPDEWRVISGAIARRLGRSLNVQADDFGDTFSTSGFLRRYQQLDAATKDALFGGQGTFRRDLENLAAVSNRIETQGAVLRNPSGTARTVTASAAAGATGISALSGNLSSAAVILSAIAANSGAARLMSSPSFVRWTARAAQLAPEKIPGHIARAARVVDVDGEEMNIALQELLGDLASSGNAEPQ